MTVSHNTGSGRRILWVSYEVPDQGGQGGQRRQFHQIRALLSYGHRITVLVPRSAQSDRSIRTITRVWRPRILLRGRPIAPMIRLMHRVMSHRHWDAVIVAHHDSWALVPEHIGTPTLLDIHNVLSRWYGDAGRAAEAAEAFAKERRGVRHALALSVCSDVERERLAQAHPSSREKTFVAPLGVDPEEWQVRGFDRRQAIVALFGSWYWGPNAAGLRWMLDDVWPAVRARLPEARLLVAGTGVTGTGGWPSGAEYVGRVPDLAEFLSSACAVPVPIFDGVGAALKFAESLASGGAVIATPDGASAFPTAPVRVSADPAEWSDWLVARLRARASEPAPAPSRSYALTRLTWVEAVRPIDAWLRDTAPRRRGNRSRRTSSAAPTGDGATGGVSNAREAPTAGSRADSPGRGGDSPGL